MKLSSIAARASKDVWTMLNEFILCKLIEIEQNPHIFASYVRVEWDRSSANS